MIKDKKRGLIERLNQGPIICAEGFLFEIEKRGYMSSGEFVPMVSLENPEALLNLHRDFQHAGSDVVQAFTYNGHREKMRVIGKEELLEPLNRAALQIAKKVAVSPMGDEQNLMAGNISNSNIWSQDDKKSQLEVEKMFREMVGWAVDEKADILIGETFYYAEEAFTALKVMKESGLPSVITIAPYGQNIMRDGVSILDTCKELEQKGGDIVGMNCHRGPNTMLPYLKEIRKKLKCHMAGLPITYRTTDEHPTFFNLPDNNGCSYHTPHETTFPTALDPMQCSRYEIGQFAREAYNLGIINKLLTEKKFKEELDEYCEDLANRAPIALSQVKKIIHQGLDMTLEDSLLLEQKAFDVTMNSKDAARAMRSLLNAQENIENEIKFKWEGD